MTRRHSVLLALVLTFVIGGAMITAAPANATAVRRPVRAHLSCPRGPGSEMYAGGYVSYSLFAEPNIVGSGTLGCNETQQLTRGNQEVPAFTVTVAGIGANTIRCLVPPPGPLPYSSSCGGLEFTID